MLPCPPWLFVLVPHPARSIHQTPHPWAPPQRVHPFALQKSALMPGPIPPPRNECFINFGNATDERKENAVYRRIKASAKHIGGGCTFSSLSLGSTSNLPPPSLRFAGHLGDRDRPQCHLISVILHPFKCNARRKSPRLSKA